MKLRKHQVEDEQVVLDGVAGKQSLFAIMALVDRKTRSFAQGYGDVLRQPSFVFNDQNAHLDFDASLRGECIRRQHVAFRRSLIQPEPF